MYYRLLLIVALNFFSLNSMEQKLIIKDASQDLFDAVAYPIAPNRRVQFEHAKLLVKSNPEKAKEQLLAFAPDHDSAYVPALRELVGLALAKADHEEAAQWAYSATARPNSDPGSSMTLAGLLGRERPLRMFMHIPAREREHWLQHLLHYAAEPKPFISGGQEYQFIHPHAHVVLEDYWQKKFPIREQQLQEQERFLAQGSAMAKAEVSTISAHEKIKAALDQAKQDSSLEHLKKAIELLPQICAQEYPELVKELLKVLDGALVTKNDGAENLVIKIIEAPEFQDVCTFELGSLLTDISAKITRKKRAAKVASVGAKQLQAALETQDRAANWKFLEQVEEQKLVRNLLAAGTPGLANLLEFAAKFKDGRACLDAVRYLFSVQESIDPEAFIKATTAYLHRAKFADVALKKEIIEFLKTAKGPKTEYQLEQTVRLLFDDFDKNPPLWEQEKSFVNALIDEMVARSESNSQMKYLLYELLNAHATNIKHPQITDPVATAHVYLVGASKRGHLGALEALALEFSTLQNSEQFLAAAADFWNLFWKSSLLPEQKKRAVTQMRKLVDYYENTIPLASRDLSFNYHALTVLAETDPQRAMRLLARSEQEIRTAKNLSANTRRLLESTGAKEFIDAQAAKRTGWGYFAQAVCKINRHHVCSTPQESILYLNELQKLFDAAIQAEQPFSDPQILSQAIIDYGQAVHVKQLCFVAEIEEGQKVANGLLEQSLELFDRAAHGGSIEAGIEWAELVLHKKSATFTGQKVFEKAVDRLIQGLQKNPDLCRERLQQMYDLGHAQCWPCGGEMTDMLYDAIKTALHPASDGQNGRTGEALNTVHEAQNEPVPHIVQAVRALNDKRYAQARELFDAESATGNPAATAYLGIMYAQGFCGRERIPDALALFKKALFAWDGKIMPGGEALPKAYRVVCEQSATDLEAAHAALHARLGIALGAQDQYTSAAIDNIFKDLEIFEKVATRSASLADRNLLFSSGISRRLLSLYHIHDDAVSLFRLVSQYARRIVDVGAPDARTHQEYLVDLLAPFNDAGSLLVTQILEQKISSIFEELNEENSRTLFENLEQALRARGTHPNIPLERTLGLLYMSRSMANIGTEQDLRKGLLYLQKAASNNDTQAALVLGNYKIYGLKKFPGILCGVKSGISILEDLAAHKNVRAMFCLADYYYDKEEYKLAEKYVKQIIDQDNANAEAMFLAAQIYYRNPSLMPERTPEGKDLDKGLFLHSLATATAINNPSVKHQALLFQVLLAISKYPYLMNIQEIADVLDEVSREQLRAFEMRGLGNQLFTNLLAARADAQPFPLTQADTKALEKIYNFLGSWNMSVAHHAIANKKSGDRYYEKAKKYIEKADMIAGEKSFFPKALQMQLALCRAFADENEQLETAKKHYVKALEILKTENISESESQEFNGLGKIYLKRLQAYQQKPK